MFDLATRPQPDTANSATLAGVPFDLRLAPPLAVSAFAYTTLVTSTGGPVPGVDLLATYSMALEGGLATAVILSLFTDRRAGPDDALPLRETDRRGWVGDEFQGGDVGATDDAWGSLLWLIYTGKAIGSVLELARFTARESLAWLLRDGIASRVDVAAQWVGARGERLAIRPTIWQPDHVAPVYDALWGTSVQRWANT